MAEPVVVERHGLTQVITINRPEVRNALDGAGARALAAAADELDADDGLRVGVLTGPGGFELMLACDLVVAGESSKFGVPEVKRAMVAGGGAALRLAEAIAANGPLAVAVTKQIARAQADWTVTEGWQRQAELYKQVFESQDAREGAAAFAEKRAPVWQGK